MHSLHVRTTVRVTNTNRKTPSGGSQQLWNLSGPVGIILCVGRLTVFRRFRRHANLEFSVVQFEWPVKCTCFRNWSETRIFPGRHVRPTVKARTLLLFLREYVWSNWSNYSCGTNSQHFREKRSEFTCHFCLPPIRKIVERATLHGSNHECCKEICRRHHWWIWICWKTRREICRRRPSMRKSNLGVAPWARRTQSISSRQDHSSNLWSPWWRCQNIELERNQCRFLHNRIWISKQGVGSKRTNESGRHYTRRICKGMQGSRSKALLPHDSCWERRKCQVELTH